MLTPCVRVWTSSGEPLSTIVNPSSTFTCPVWSADSARLAVVNNMDYAIHVFDVATGAPVATVAVHHQPISWLDWGSDGSFVITHNNEVVRYQQSSIASSTVVWCAHGKNTILGRAWFLPGGDALLIVGSADIIVQRFDSRVQRI